MTNFYVSSVGYTAVAQFAINTGYVSTSNGGRGDYIRQLAAPAVNSERVFRCTTSGTTGAAEAAWNLNNGVTTTQGTAVFTECTGAEADQAAGNWKAPAARIANITARGGTASANTLGDVIFLSQDHAETQASSWSPFSAVLYDGLRVVCCQRGGGSSMPPVSADLVTTPTASISSTGSNDITLQGGSSAGSSIMYENVIFKSGRNIIGASANSSELRLKSCSVVLNNATSSSVIRPNNNILSVSRWDNVTLTFGHVGQSIQTVSSASGVYFEWKNTPSALAGSVPTTLFTQSSVPSGVMDLHGLDLSALNTTLFSNAAAWGNWFVNGWDNRLNSAVALTSATPGAIASPGGFFFMSSDDSTNNRTYRRMEMRGHYSVDTVSTVVRTGGASDGVSSFSDKVVFGNSLQIGEGVYKVLSRYWSATGSSVTATIYFVVSAATALTNADLSLDVEALTNSGNIQGSVTSNFIADFLTAGSPHATDTSAWDTGAPARINNHVYAVGDVFKTATCPGQIFIVTTGGTSATSEPAAYTGVADGTQITTDRNGGSMTVRCMIRQKMTQAFTPQVAGMVLATIRSNQATGSTLFIDPKLYIA
jgi:hypothetical protein